MKAPLVATLLLGILIVSSAAGVGVASSVGRPQFQFDAAHTGGDRSGWGNEFELGWATQVDGPVQTAPAIVGDVVLFGTMEGTLYAANLDDGAHRWSLRIGDPIISSPVSNGGTAFFGAGNRLLAVDVASGTTKWSTRLGGNVTATPTICSDGVVVGSQQGTLTSHDRETGEVQWTLQTASPLDSPGPSSGITASATFHGGVLYVGAHDGVLYALTCDQGLLRWTFNARALSPSLLGTPEYIQSPAAVTSDHVVVQTFHGHVYALDPTTGWLQWRAQLAGTGLHFTPSVADDLALVSGIDTPYLAAFDLDSGAERWRLERQVFPAVAIGSGVAYVPSLSELLAIDLEAGTIGEVFTLDEGEAWNSPPTVWDGRLYIGSGAGRMLAFVLGPESGDGEYRTETPIPSAAGTSLLLGVLAMLRARWRQGVSQEEGTSDPGRLPGDLRYL